MSAAGRGPRLGGKDDFYETPDYCVHRLLDAFIEDPELSLDTGGLWLEPAAGDGAIVRAVREWFKKRNLASLVPMFYGMDIREDAAALKEPGFECGDYLLDRPSCLLGSACDHAACGPKVVITNPPFSLASEFFLRTRELYPNAFIILLLRIPWLASAKRNAMLRADMPDLMIIPDRPSFTNSGTDSTEYGWMLWHPGVRRTKGSVSILGVTPLEERKRR